jgi:sugar lactone lactonase YvrE
MPGSMPWEDPKPGAVTVVLPDGSSRQVAGDVWFPNGMVVLGEDTLVVAESHADRLTAWTITETGDLVDRRVWADLGPGSAPDGICADTDGAIWYASVPGQRCTRVAQGGQVLDTIDADRGCFACMLGGDDRRTLYIVANHYTGSGSSDGVVLIEPVAVPGAGRP